MSREKDKHPVCRTKKSSFVSLRCGRCFAFKQLYRSVAGQERIRKKEKEKGRGVYGSVLAGIRIESKVLFVSIKAKVGNRGAESGNTE